MYIRATITSTTGFIRLDGFLSESAITRYGIEFRAPHTVEWQFTKPAELTIVPAHRVGYSSIEFRTAMRDAGRGHLLP